VAFSNHTGDGLALTTWCARHFPNDDRGGIEDWSRP